LDGIPIPPSIRCAQKRSVISVPGYGTDFEFSGRVKE